MKPLQILLIACMLGSIALQAQTSNPFQSIHKKTATVTLTDGKYKESYDDDVLQRIGSVVIDTRTKKVVKMMDADSISNSASDNTAASRWISTDPLAAKYPNISPYVYATNNPIRFIDPDGKDIVDPNGKHVTITHNEDGTLSFSKNATTSIIRVANDLNITETGRTQLNTVDKSDIHVSINISESTKGNLTFGETQQGKSDGSDIYQKADGTYGVKSASITIYEGSLEKGTAPGSGYKNEGLTVDEAIGATAGHEIVHATDKSEINKDIKAAQTGTERKDGEVKARAVESKIIKESKDGKQ